MAPELPLLHEYVEQHSEGQLRRTSMRRLPLPWQPLVAVFEIVVMLVMLITHFTLSSPSSPSNHGSPSMNSTRSQSNLTIDPSLTFPQPDLPLYARTTRCGSTATEARLAGCLFDVMMGRWLPAECVPLDLMEGYISERTWEWYADYRLTEHIPLDVVRLGVHPWTFGPIRLHDAHCAYVWEKQGRVLAPGLGDDGTSGVGWLDMESLEMNHTQHCAGLLTQSKSKDEYSEVHNWIDGCSPVGTRG